jgi:hypothetical protein
MSNLVQIYDELNVRRSQKKSKLNFSDLACIVKILLTLNPDQDNKYKDVHNDMLNIQKHLSENEALESNKASENSKLSKNINAIVKDLQDINHVVSVSASGILDALEEFNDSKGHKVDKTALNKHITEKCSFHDLVGQRVSRGIQKLNLLASSIHKLGLTSETDFFITMLDNAQLGSSNENLVNGPARIGEGLSQFEVDNMFKKESGTKK